MIVFFGIEFLNFYLGGVQNPIPPFSNVLQQFVGTLIRNWTLFYYCVVPAVPLWVFQSALEKQCRNRIIVAGVGFTAKTKRLKGYFFFQAEDGIRYLTVTGVQTCALPI